MKCLYLDPGLLVSHVQIENLLFASLEWLIIKPHQEVSAEGQVSHLNSVVHRLFAFHRVALDLCRRDRVA